MLLSHSPRMGCVRVWMIQTLIHPSLNTCMNDVHFVFIILILRTDFVIYLVARHPMGTQGLKSRMCPRYPHKCRKRLLKWGAVI